MNKEIENLLQKLWFGLWENFAMGSAGEICNRTREEIFWSLAKVYYENGLFH